MTTVQPCPFCPLLLPDQQDLHEAVWPGVQIAGEPACSGCALFVGYYPEQVEVLINALLQQRASSRKRKDFRTSMTFRLLLLVANCLFLIVVWTKYPRPEDLSTNLVLTLIVGVFVVFLFTSRKILKGS